MSPHLLGGLCRLYGMPYDVRTSGGPHFACSSCSAMLWAFSDNVAPCVCTLQTLSRQSRPRNILFRTEHGWPRGQTICTHGMVRITGILRLMLLSPVLRLWGCSRLALWLFRCIPVVLSTRSPSHRGVFGTLHSDLSHSLGSDLCLVSQICLYIHRSRLEDPIASCHCIDSKRAKKRYP